MVNTKDLKVGDYIKTDCEHKKEGFISNIRNRGLFPVTIVKDESLIGKTYKELKKMYYNGDIGEKDWGITSLEAIVH